DRLAAAAPGRDRTRRARQRSLRPRPCLLYRKGRRGKVFREEYAAAADRRTQDRRGRRPRLDGSPRGVLLTRVFQLHEGRGDAEELIGAELPNGLDIEGFVQQLGILVGHSGQRSGRRIEDLLERLALVRLVERLVQIDGYRHGPS